MEERALRAAVDHAQHVVASAAGDELAAHVADCVRTEHGRLGDRFGNADASDLLAELRHELAAAAARAGLTVAALEGRGVQLGDGAGVVDGALREAVAALDRGYGALTGALDALGRRRGPRPSDAPEPEREPVEAWPPRVEQRPALPPRIPREPSESAAAPAQRGRPPAKLERAVELLAELLAHGPQPPGELLHAAQQVGIARGTLKRAAERLGVVRGSRGRHARWRLPGAEKEAPRAELAPPSPPSPEVAGRDQALDGLRAALADGNWHPAAPIVAAIVAEGIPREAAWAAADQLAVERDRDGALRWRLPAVEAEAAA